MKELIEALHVIQNECNKHKDNLGFYDCRKCPLSMMEDMPRCMVKKEFPKNWKINDEVQKALL